eukprot:4953003-Pleurochrysis_carterae.AAC.1
MLTAVVYQEATAEWHEHECQKSESEGAVWARKLGLAWHLVVLSRLLFADPVKSRIVVHRRVAVVRSILCVLGVVVAG